MKSPRSTTRTLSPDARNAQAAVQPAMPDPTMTMSVSMVEPVGSSTARASVDAVPCGMVSLRFVLAAPSLPLGYGLARPGGHGVAPTWAGRVCANCVRSAGIRFCDDRGRLIG